MVVDKNLIKEKLESLENFILQVENMNFDEQGLVENVDVQQLLSFRLQQSIEICIDIATHIIAIEALEKAETARDAFTVLAKNKIISEKTAEGMSAAGSFRNIIVHGYGKVDFSKLYYDYKKDLEDLRNYAKEINLFLEKTKNDSS